MNVVKPSVLGNQLLVNGRVFREIDPAKLTATVSASNVIRHRRIQPIPVAAERKLPVVDPQICLKTSGALVHPNTDKACRICPVLFRVRHVLSMGYLPQVFRRVVVLARVDMIDLQPLP